MDKSLNDVSPAQEDAALPPEDSSQTPPQDHDLSPDEISQTPLKDGGESSPEVKQVLSPDNAEPPPVENDQEPPGEGDAPLPEASSQTAPQNSDVLPWLAESNQELSQEDDGLPPEADNHMPSRDNDRLALEKGGQIPGQEVDELPAQKSSRMPLVMIGVALVAAFAVGLIGGFLGRPLVLQDVPVQVMVTVIPPDNPQPVAQANAPVTPETIGGDAGQEADTTSAAPAQPTPTIMDFLLTDARHFQGSDAAPVTLIEFSDFK